MAEEASSFKVMDATKDRLNAKPGETGSFYCVMPENAVLYKIIKNVVEKHLLNGGHISELISNELQVACIPNFVLSRVKIVCVTVNKADGKVSFKDV